MAHWAPSQQETAAAKGVSRRLKADWCSRMERAARKIP